MDATRVQSFTEKALLNRFALNFFSPTSFEPVHLESINHSICESFFKAKTNPFAATEKKQNILLKGAHLLITTPMRVAYIGLTVLYVSRIGVLFNGAMLGALSLKYAFTSDGEDSKKAKQYGYAFLQDLACATLGACIAKIAFENLAHLTYITKLTPSLGRAPITSSRTILLGQALFSTAATVAMVAVLISLQTPYGASNVFANPEERCGMYLSFAFRNQLGIVDKKGGLLPFSRRDQFTNGQGLNTNFKNLLEMISNAEIDLIKLVAKINQKLPETEKIQFTYPFNTTKIGDLLHKKIPTGNESLGLAPQTPFAIFESEVRELGRKIDVLLDLFVKVPDLSINPSWIISLLDEKSQRVKFNKPASFFKSDKYQNLFRLFSGMPDATPTNLGGSQFIDWERENAIVAVDPQIERPKNDKYEALKYDIGVLKYKNPQKINYEEIGHTLGLSKELTWAAFRSAQKKALFLLHPDKHIGNETEAGAYFKLISDVFKIWEKENFKEG